jgi:hypothetical protein
LEVIPIEHAGAAVLTALREDSAPETDSLDN